MRVVKIMISIDDHLLGRLDKLMMLRRFPSRSKALQEASREKLKSTKRTRLARECAKLDRSAEKTLADEGLSGKLA